MATIVHAQLRILKQIRWRSWSPTSEFPLGPLCCYSSCDKTHPFSVKTAAFCSKIPIFLYNKTMLLMLIPREASTPWRPKTQRSGNTEQTQSIYARHPLCNDAFMTNMAAHSGGVTKSHGHMTSWMPRRMTPSLRPEIHKEHTKVRCAHFTDDRGCLTLQRGHGAKMCN